MLFEPNVYTDTGRIVGLVMSTNYASEYVSNSIAAVATIREIDFSIFSDSINYIDYATRIRKEYGLLTDSEYVDGRLAFLNSLYTDLYTKLPLSNDKARKKC